MTRTPPKPPIVRRLEARRTNRRDRDSGLDLMFWACVAVAIAGLYGIFGWGGR